MQRQSEQRTIIEFGDFQTPEALAADVCQFLAGRGVAPAAFVEPTRGTGSFVLAALDRFPDATGLGTDINPAYVAQLQASIRPRKSGGQVKVFQENFFEADWQTRLRGLPQPVLVLGNPPWVTNAQLGAMGAGNLPEKSNFQGHMGLAAITGKSNFDISEWMLIRLLEGLAGRRAWLAMLCKTAVARKALVHAWRNRIAIEWAEMRSIDACKFFGAAVDACLLACSLSPASGTSECSVYANFEAAEPTRVIGWRDGQLVADVRAYSRSRHLAGESPYVWRSGVKHDCSKVMELQKEARGFRNGFGQLVELENEYVFPMLKSSDLANGHVDRPRRWMVVPQRSVGENTAELQTRAPQTWRYLIEHGAALDRRGSSIYRNRSRFSVFGVGEYTFAPWKVAISGFYKHLKFTVVAPSEGKPVVFDDTIYFVPCQAEAEARAIAALLNSDAARDFFSAYVFWDAKRPITADLLRRLDVQALARDVAGS